MTPAEELLKKLAEANERDVTALQVATPREDTPASAPDEKP